MPRPRCSSVLNNSQAAVLGPRLARLPCDPAGPGGSAEALIPLFPHPLRGILAVVVAQEVVERPVVAPHGHGPREEAFGRDREELARRGGPVVVQHRGPAFLRVRNQPLVLGRHHLSPAAAGIRGPQPPRGPRPSVPPLHVAGHPPPRPLPPQPPGPPP